jgi:hypothetical protein
MAVKTVHNLFILSDILGIAFNKNVFSATLLEVCWPNVIVFLQLHVRVSNMHELSRMF